MTPEQRFVLAKLGVRYLFPYQELVVQRLLESAELRQAVILPTGAGKSLCFQLPALLFPHPTLVIYPLRSLTADQKQRSERSGLVTVVLQGGQTRQQRQSVWDCLAGRRVNLILTNPETLAQPEVLRRLSSIRLSHAVVDEAHCVELWGKSFRPSYRALGELLAGLEVPRITAFTATATQEMERDWQDSLFCGRPSSTVRASADRPNLDLSHEPYLSLRLSLPRAVLREKRPALVFCRSREQVRRWAHHLHRETGLPVRFYHAGLGRDEKDAVEAWYLGSEDGVLVSTNAYGMGVDKPNIRTVFHLQAAPSPADYLQEAGRAARDGDGGRAILFVPDRASREAQGCRRARLLKAFGESQTACSGCDVCRGQQDSPPREAGQALMRLARYGRRLTRDQTREFLFGRVTPDLWEVDLTRSPQWGLWANEDDLTCQELWKGLVQGGWIRFHAHGPWRGLLAR